MKKLMSILGTISVVGSTVTAVVACGEKGDLITFVTPETSNEYFTTLENAAKKYVRSKYKNIYKVGTARSNNDVAVEQTNLETAISSGSKGIMFVPVKTDGSAGAEKVAANGTIPFAAVDRLLSPEAGVKVDSSFYTDGALASESMAHELYDVMVDGRADIKYGDQIETIYIKGDESADSTISRHKGFMIDAVFDEKMVEKAKEAGNDTVKVGDNLFVLPEGVKQASWVGTEMEPPNGMALVNANPGDVAKAKLVISMNDPMAGGAMEAIKGNATLSPMLQPKSGDKIGLIVVGFDAQDSIRKQINEWAENKANVFASVAQNPVLMAEKAVQFIIDEIENDRPNKDSDKKEPIDTENIIATKLTT
ncbi:ribose transport system substrate-binding protein [Spiroplasma chinense]|uniref:Ribose transport system substrate-binding protein n=1 Tax=Spiroplasma chinense TaxID=216932 RepID=A0A5B9Y489_9MOLU|nr:substrate-binding domain-containing protein [Spiroplasma chinense]QEH61851.1 ribose transport system substrate-binding protein [Spiroplasma chinense]